MKTLIISAIVLFISVLQSNSQDLKQLSSAGQVDSLIKSYSGKTVMVNFWATWCDPCEQEFPDLVRLYNDYKGKDFVLIFISLDQTSDVKTKVLPFLKNNGVDFTTFINTFKKPEELMDFFDKKWDGAIPATYVYNEAGVQTSAMIGGKTYAEFEQQVKEDISN